MSRQRIEYGTPNHWTTWFVEKLTAHGTINATLAATGLNPARVYRRMATDPAFAKAVSSARRAVARQPNHFKPKGEQ
jgi:ketopantoate reductase